MKVVHLLKSIFSLHVQPVTLNMRMLPAALSAQLLYLQCII